MRTPKRIHTDRAPEFVSVVRSYPGGGIHHDTSIPGCPQTNSIVEARVKKSMRGTRSLLLGAGLPHCWWPVAARRYAFLHNVVEGYREAKTKWERRHGHPFEGPCIPFGALVHAMPSLLRKDDNLKFEGPMRPAVFLGYVTQPGERWCGEYRWAFVDDFVGKSFYSRVAVADCRVTIHQGRELRFDVDSEVVFPCESWYDRDNETVEGVSLSMEGQSEAEEAPGAQSLEGPNPEVERDLGVVASAGGDGIRPEAVIDDFLAEDELEVGVVGRVVDRTREEPVSAGSYPYGKGRTRKVVGPVWIEVQQGAPISAAVHTGGRLEGLRRSSETSDYG